MKKLFVVLMVLAVAFTAFAQGGQEAAKSDEVKIAMVTDYGDITDQSFNQTTYEACRDYANAHGIGFQYF
ncbi:MAG: BMP family ABC transporter substrate-binding protein, partial [Spirochaetales bacterium]|nr:BMP family ABC transporter substrate-binding protein [Spirochaetales bacterium]